MLRKRRFALKKLLISFALVLPLMFATNLHAQEFDAGLGFGTSTAPAASNGFPSESGGLYMSFSGIVRLKHHIGFGGEVAPRLRQAPYGVSNGSIFLGVQPYRPIFYDFNAVYGSTWMKKKLGGDIMAGIGGEDLRFYTPYYNCGAFSCTNYVSSNHFAWHFGGDVRFYVWGHAFVRPEVHYYVIHNNVEFNNVNVARYAISIGYSFLPGF
jgi:hypothetical protein